MPPPPRAVAGKEGPAAAAAATPAALAAGLAADASQQLAALGGLLAAAPAPTAAQGELVRLGVPARLLELLGGAASSTDKSVRLQAARALAAYASSAGQPLQHALSTPQAAQVLWAVLESYQSAQHAIAAALAEPAPLKAAAAAARKQTPAAKEALDPDEWLPGPSKFLLEATLRALSSVLAAADAATSAAPAAAEGGVRSWLVQQPPTTLVCLLLHASGRVQMRAARLALQLTRAAGWCDAFTAAGGVAAAVRLTCPGAGTPVLRLLQRLAGATPTSGAALALVRQQLLDALMAMLLQPLVTAAAGSAASAAAKSGSRPDASKAGAGASRDVGLQLAAADLLSCMCAASSGTAQLLVHRGGLEVLSALLPSAPPPPEQPELTAGQQADQVVGADISLSNGSSGSSSGAGSAVVPPRMLSGGEGEAHLGALQGITSQQLPSPKQDLHAGPRPGSPSPAPAAVSAYSAPAGCKAHNPDVQGKLLEVLAALLSHPAIVTGQQLLSSQLPRQLLHLFAAPPPKPQPPALSSEQPASAAGSSADTAAAAAAAVPQASSQAAAVKAGVGVGKSGAQTPRSGAAAPPAAGGKAALSVNTHSAEVASSTSSSGGVAHTPRKAPGAAAAPAAAGASQHKVDAGGTLADPSSAPVSAAVVKAPALACLVHLARDKALAQHLAAQRVCTPPGNSAASPPAPAAASSRSGGGASSNGPTPRRQQEQQEQAVGEAVPMLQQVLLDVQSLLEGAGSISSQALVLNTLAAAAELAGALAQSLNDEQLTALPMLATLQVLARCTKAQGAPAHVQSAVSRALLLLPDAALVPPPRPPLPSPPPTPPPPPLPTSQFAWDALGRPCVTDGVMVVSLLA